MTSTEVNPFEGQTQQGMAPPDLGWHFRYAQLMGEMFDKVSRLLRETEGHDPKHSAEDLGDWLDMLSTLLSFRPRTRDDIEKTVREMKTNGN